MKSTQPTAILDVFILAMLYSHDITTCKPRRRRWAPRLWIFGQLISEYLKVWAESAESASEAMCPPVAGRNFGTKFGTASLSTVKQTVCTIRNHVWTYPSENHMVASMSAVVQTISQTGRLPRLRPKALISPAWYDRHCQPLLQESVFGCYGATYGKENQEASIHKQR
jgi:hypothetical protein